MSTNDGDSLEDKITDSQNGELASAPRFEWGNRLLLVIATGLFVLGVAATAYRANRQYQVPGSAENSPTDFGMCDFHNGMYFPGRAVLNGVSPYGQDYADSNPVSRQIPFFSPSILVLHTPVILLPLHIGDIVFFAISVAILVTIGLLLSSVADRPIRVDFAMTLAAIMIFSRAGHINLYDGYFTFELVLATFLAIHWADRKPVLAALALVIVSAKPTHILPLGFLMLARGNYRAIIIGAIFSIVAAAVPLLWIAHHEGDGDIGRGVEILLHDIQATQEHHRAQPDESPANSWTRIDLLAAIAKWTRHEPGDLAHIAVMLVFLIPSMLLLFRRQRAGIDDGLLGLSGAIILVTSIVALYHQSYDALLVTAPLAGVIARKPEVWRASPLRLRILIGSLIVVPMFSYFSSQTALNRLNWGDLGARVLTSVSAVCFVLLLGILLFLAARESPAKSE